MLLYYTLLFCIFLLFVFAGEFLFLIVLSLEDRTDLTRFTFHCPPHARPPAYYSILYFRPSLLPSLIRPNADGSTASYLPLPTSFAEQIRSGFTSRYFDLEAHNSSEGAGGETREGLDEQGLAEVREIMRVERLNFDRARLVRQERLFARNGVDRWGMPLDAKAVVRL